MHQIQSEIESGNKINYEIEYDSISFYTFERYANSHELKIFK